MTAPGGMRARLRAATGVADQLLYSLTNFVLTVLVAHFSSASTFGAYAVLTATFLVVSGMNRGIASEPLIIRTSAEDRDVWRANAQIAMARAFWFGIAAGAVTFGGSCLLLHAEVLHLALIFALSMPLLFVQDFLRYAALAVKQPRIALLNDVVVAIVQWSVSAAAIVTGVASAGLFIVVWAVAGLAGGLVGLALLRLRPRLVGWREMSRDSDLSGRLGMDYLARGLSQQGIGYAVAAVAGFAAAGGLRAAQTVFLPSSILVLGFQSALLPELVRLQAVSLRRMRRALTVVNLGCVAVGVVYAAAVLVSPTSFGVRLFGESWLQGKSLLLLIAISTLGGNAANSAVLGLRALSDAQRTLIARSIVIVLTLVAVVPGAIVDGARGASLAFAVSSWVQAAVWWSYFSLAYRDRRQERGKQRVAQTWQALLESRPDERPARHQRPGLDALGRAFSPLDELGHFGADAPPGISATVTDA